MTVKFQKLTRAAMRSLKPNEKLNEHGIEYTRLTDLDGRFTLNIMVDGKRIHRVIGKESEGVTRQQAQDLITQLRSKAREKRLKLPKGRKLAMSFEQAAPAYLARLQVENGNEINKKEQRINKHMIPFFKNHVLSDLHSSDIERYKQHRLQQGAEVSTINRELSVISHLFTKAVDWHWVESKPCYIKKFKEDGTRKIYLTNEQIKRVLECASRHQSPHIYAFMMVGLSTSMRLTEILSIEIKNIDIEKQIIYVPQAKAGSREQPMTADLSEFLKRYLTSERKASRWLFPSTRSKCGHATSIEESFRKVITSAGLNGSEVTPHTLRHTVITHLVQAGVDLPTVQRVSGHKTLQMVVRYSHQNGEHIRAAMDALQKRYEEAV